MLQLTKLGILFAVVILQTFVLSNKVSAEDILEGTTDSPVNCPDKDGKGTNINKESCPMEGKPKLTECAPYPFPESEEGPFFLPDQPVRSDIREDKPGIPYTLNIRVTTGDGTSCSPVKNASVHLWHPDALGVYSAYLGYYPLGQPGSKPITGAHSEPTDKSTFLRGIQHTDENGEVTFKTIYPGWYMFRALHMHFKVFAEDGTPKLTGEFYFPEDVTDKVAIVEPYTQNKGRRIPNKEDWQFDHQMGQRSMIQPEGSVETEFRSTVAIGLRQKP